ncbi:DinI-like family protein [Erwinia sp.]|uniref:DinI-like family protein n=1 Tax=Erwinia citreus TaxID=558 RepID=UPI00289CAFA3|nr:DinI-like family protein [Erwinia sp.]
MLLDVTINKESGLGKEKLQAFEAELHRQVIAVFPATKISVHESIESGFEMAGFTLESDRHALTRILQTTMQTFQIPY